MKVSELIENLQATGDMDKEVLIDVDGVRYTIENRLLGYENHVDIITDKKYMNSDYNYSSNEIGIQFRKRRYKLW